MGNQNRQPFKPHPNFSDSVNKTIIDMEMAGGFSLEDLKVGDILEVETNDHILSIERKPDCTENEYYVSGHPQFYPEPVKVRIAGSKLAHEGHGMISVGRVERGRFLELRLPGQGPLEFITTAEILDMQYFSLGTN